MLVVVLEPSLKLPKAPVSCCIRARELGRFVFMVAGDGRLGQTAIGQGPIFHMLLTTRGYVPIPHLLKILELFDFVLVPIVMKQIRQLFLSSVRSHIVVVQMIVPAHWYKTVV
jgi:hypothetical protein